jgi:hypothetical protein
MKRSVLDALEPSYIVDGAGKKTAVVLDLATFDAIIEELEDLHDIICADEVLVLGEDEKGPTLEELEKKL